jgi:Mg-chelatase subunit ChlD
MLHFARPATAFAAALCLAPLAPVAFSAEAPVNVMFIVDASGSMKRRSARSRA